MIRALTTLLFLPILCISDAHAIEDTHIDSKLQNALSTFVRNLQHDQIGQTEILKEQLKTLTEFKVSVCLLNDWLRSIDPKIKERNGKLEYLLGDKIDEHMRVVNQTQKAIASRIGLRSKTKDETEKILRELAVTIAANELSLRTIENEVIPKLFESSGKLIKEVESLDSKVELLSIKYRADFDSLCDRVSLIEREIQGMKGASQVSNASWEQPTSSAYTTNAPERASYTTQRWQPDAYVSTSALCPNARLKESSYTYYARVHTPNGVVTKAMFGDVYVNCGGKIVMVLR
jgi:hypothetical protein